MEETFNLINLEMSSIFFNPIIKESGTFKDNSSFWFYIIKERGTLIDNNPIIKECHFVPFIDNLFYNPIIKESISPIVSPSLISPPKVSYSSLGGYAFPILNQGGYK